MAPGSLMRSFNRYLLAGCSMLIGSQAVHAYFKPDLTVPEIPVTVVKEQLQIIEGFQPASQYEGSRPGFVFKAGAAGLGYYPDIQSK
mmetsp:Transcript_57839/g.125556  ORF Transcript_57839/g.125556 Transcript_57839/m.125556 type:complete len:87 (-) Transcript_57839:108-368(-)